MRVRRAGLCAILLLAPCAGALEDPARVAAELVRTRADRGWWFPAGPLGVENLDNARRVQQELVRLTIPRRGGFKAALTTEASRRRFRAETPLLGVLSADSLIPADGIVDLSGFRLAKIEMEVAFVLTRPVTGRVEGLEALRDMVLVAPALEFPDLAFEHPEAVTALDLVVVNVAPGRFLVGQEMPPAKVDLRQVNPVLRREGVEIARGRSEDAMGDPWQSLLWIVREAHERGFRPVAGDILLTGALGGMAPVEPGRHQADFGPLGVIPFVVR